jgi:hypothetical protein
MLFVKRFSGDPFGPAGLTQKKRPQKRAPENERRFSGLQFRRAGEGILRANLTAFTRPKRFGSLSSAWPAPCAGFAARV